MVFFNAELEPWCELADMHGSLFEYLESFKTIVIHQNSEKLYWRKIHARNVR